MTITIVHKQKYANEAHTHSHFSEITAMKSKTHANLVVLLLLFLTTNPSYAQETTNAADLREVINDIRSGSPNLDDMEPQLRIAVRERELEIVHFLRNLGPVVAINFEETNQGVDIYHVQFRNAGTIWQFARSPRGRIAILYFQTF